MNLQQQITDLVDSSLEEALLGMESESLSSASQDNLIKYQSVYKELDYVFQAFTQVKSILKAVATIFTTYRIFNESFFTYKEKELRKKLNYLLEGEFSKLQLYAYRLWKETKGFATLEPVLDNEITNEFYTAVANISEGKREEIKKIYQEISSTYNEEEEMLQSLLVRLDF